MTNQIETFDLNEYQHEAFDYNDVHDLYGGLFDWKIMAIGWFNFDTKWTIWFWKHCNPNDLDVEIKLA